MYALPASPQTIGGVLDSGIQLFKASFAQCWALALMSGIASAGASIYQALSGPIDAADPFAQFRSPTLWTVLVVGGLLSAILYIAVCTESVQSLPAGIAHSGKRWAPASASCRGYSWLPSFSRSPCSLVSCCLSFQVYM